MKRRLFSFHILGFVLLLVLGTAASLSWADDRCQPKSPVRGSWSFSQFVPFVSGTPIPGTGVGILSIDACGNLTGRGIVNPADPNFAGFEFAFDGKCVIRENGGGVMDCTLNALGQTDIRRGCVLMEEKGGCFQEFRCVSTDGVNEPGTVLLAEFKRQKDGSCQ